MSAAPTLMIYTDDNSPYAFLIGCAAAEADGVFGVPSFTVGRELCWGGEHLPELRAILLQRPME